MENILKEICKALYERNGLLSIQNDLLETIAINISNVSDSIDTVASTIVENIPDTTDVICNVSESIDSLKDSFEENLPSMYSTSTKG